MNTNELDRIFKRLRYQHEHMVAQSSRPSSFFFDTTYQGHDVKVSLSHVKYTNDVARWEFYINLKEDFNQVFEKVKYQSYRFYQDLDLGLTPYGNPPTICPDKSIG